MVGGGLEAAGFGPIKLNVENTYTCDLKWHLCNTDRAPNTILIQADPDRQTDRRLNFILKALFN